VPLGAKYVETGVRIAIIVNCHFYVIRSVMDVIET